MGYAEFYRQLFAPLKSICGPLDPDTVFAVMGFDGGGPLNFNTIGRTSGAGCATYVSCELAPRAEQQPSEFGRYELLTSCSDERWVRRWLSDIRRMSLHEAFADGDTVDFGECVDPSEPIQGVVLEKMYDVAIGQNSYGVLRCIGITRAEMEYARKNGSRALLSRLKEAGVYPITDVARRSVI